MLSSQQTNEVKRQKMNRKTYSTCIKTFLLLFTVNIFLFYLYFLPPSSFSSSSSPIHNHPDKLPQLKPWPMLPSFLPWSQNPKTNTCEAFFGDGFTQMLPFRRGEGGGWFRCRYSETLRSSLCEGGGVRMATERIRMARGGEKLEEVMGRKETEELPVFEEGAFEVEGFGAELGFRGRNLGKRRVVSEEELERYFPDNGVERHTMRELIRGVRVVAKGELQCDQVIM